MQLSFKDDAGIVCAAENDMNAIIQSGVLNEKHTESSSILGNANRRNPPRRCKKNSNFKYC